MDASRPARKPSFVIPPAIPGVPVTQGGLTWIVDEKAQTVTTYQSLYLIRKTEMEVLKSRSILTKAGKPPVADIGVCQVLLPASRQDYTFEQLEQLMDMTIDEQLVALGHKEAEPETEPEDALGSPPKLI